MRSRRMIIMVKVLATDGMAKSAVDELKSKGYSKEQILKAIEEVYHDQH